MPRNGLLSVFSEKTFLGSMSYKNDLKRSFINYNRKQIHIGNLSLNLMLSFFFTELSNRFKREQNQGLYMR